jgi:excisionase family DNA binding protein
MLETSDPSSSHDVTKRKRGRPPGSRNKPKPRHDVVVPIIAPAAMRIPEAARYIGISVSFMKKLIAHGQVRTVAIGRTRLVLVASLNALLGG